MKRNRPNRQSAPDPATADDLQRSAAVATRLLARREHSEYEMRRKLSQRGFSDVIIDTVLADLLEQGLLSEQRFVDSYIRSRIARGYGPRRIEAELRERGVSDVLVQPGLAEQDPVWLESASRQRERKFGQANPPDYTERARQMRFLQQRGFTGEQIRQVFSGLGQTRN